MPPFVLIVAVNDANGACECASQIRTITEIYVFSFVGEFLENCCLDAGLLHSADTTHVAGCSGINVDFR